MKCNENFASWFMLSSCTIDITRPIISWNISSYFIPVQVTNLLNLKRWPHMENGKRTQNAARKQHDNNPRQSTYITYPYIFTLLSKTGTVTRFVPVGRVLLGHLTMHHLAISQGLTATPVRQNTFWSLITLETWNSFVNMMLTKLD